MRLVVGRRVSALSVRGDVTAALGRFRKKQVTGGGPAIGAPKKGQEDEKTKAEKNYSDALLKGYKYAAPKDTRSKEEKKAFAEESRRWAKLVMEKEKTEQAHEQGRLDFMWEAINALPPGSLRDHAMTEDITPAPAVMNAVRRPFFRVFFCFFFFFFFLF